MVAPEQETIKVWRPEGLWGLEVEKYAYVESGLGLYLWTTEV